jgi:DUF971 family protein
MIVLSNEGISMEPRQIRLKEDSCLVVFWDDQHREEVSLQKLRDHCPCAECQGESVLFHTYKPVPQPELPGKYLLTNIQPVGNYGLQLIWGDGHSSGIYTWEILRSLCECVECKNKSEI